MSMTVKITKGQSLLAMINLTDVYYLFKSISVSSPSPEISDSCNVQSLPCGCFPSVSFLVHPWFFMTTKQVIPRAGSAALSHQWVPIPRHLWMAASGHLGIRFNVACPELVSVALPLFSHSVSYLNFFHSIHLSILFPSLLHPEFWNVCQMLCSRITTSS